jgi:hypothetical protein
MVYGGVHPGWFFAGVGMLFATDYGEGFRDDSFTEIPDGVQVLVPRVDAGIDVELSGRLRFQLLAVAYPEEVLRLGVTYGF